MKGAIESGGPPVRLVPQTGNGYPASLVLNADGFVARRLHSFGYAPSSRLALVAQSGAILDSHFRFEVLVLAGSILLVVCAGLACSSGNNAVPGQTGGASGTGGKGTGSGGSGSGGSGGSGSGSGGTFGSSGGSDGSRDGGSAGQGSGGSGDATARDAAARDATARDATATDAQHANSDGATDEGPGGFEPCPTTGDCKILPLGDSITAGAGAQPGDGAGYRTELFTQAASDSKHITFVGSLTSGPNTVAGVAFPRNHEGHIGYKIDQISSLATTSQTVVVSGQSVPGALRDMPHIVLLFIGTNDEGFTSSQPGASDRLGQLIDKIVAALPNSLLVVSSIYSFPGCTAPGCAAAVAAYDGAVPGVVKQRSDQGKHVVYVDMSGLPSGGLSTDGVHPNDTVGYPWIGDNWYAAIKSYLL